VLAVSVLVVAALWALGYYGIGKFPEHHDDGGDRDRSGEDSVRG